VDRPSTYGRMAAGRAKCACGGACYLIPRFREDRYCRPCTHGNMAALRALTTTSPPLPRILTSRVGDGLPLEIRNRIGSATGERSYVIFPVAGTSTACFAGRWAGVLPLEFSCHFTGSIFLSRKRGGTSERDRQRDNEGCPRHRP
jgi:hypothetical protein